MQSYPVQTDKSRLFSPLVLDYLERKESLLPFINHWPDAEGFSLQMAERDKSPVDRQFLHSALLHQYSGVPLKEAAAQNIEKLLSPDTYTVTTGQQIHIFLGPMYVYWKIVSAIGLANDLKKKHPGKDFVPVFWMATEDHDFEEINYVDIFNKKFQWENGGDFSGPVGLRDTSGLLPILSELDELFSRQEEWKKWSELFHRAYTEYQNFAQATRFLVNEIFGDHGLVILDPNDASLKTAFKPVIMEELLKRGSAEAVESKTRILEKTYSRQVNPREINLFYFDGQRRERIEFNGEVYQTHSGKKLCDATGVTDFVENFLADISANVILRPVYQELILPNLAYVGGPGEIAYWLQLKGVFDLYNVPFPILENRRSVFLLNPKTNEQIEKTGFKASHLFEGEKELSQMAIELSGEHLVSTESELSELLGLKDRVIKKTGPFLPSNVKPIAEFFTQLEKFLKKNEKDIYGVQKNGVDKTLEKMLKWKKLIKDEGFTQERNQFIIQYLFTLNHSEIIYLFSRNYDGIPPVSILIA